MSVIVGVRSENRNHTQAFGEGKGITRKGELGMRFTLNVGSRMKLGIVIMPPQPLLGECTLT